MIELEACALAGEMLRTAGFEHRYTSMKSEACYYALPNRSQAIRVAAHRGHRYERREMPIVASVTFNSRNFRERISGIPQISRSKVVEAVAMAIGRYMLTTGGAIRASARYREHWGGGDRELSSLTALPE